MPRPRVFVSQPGCLTGRQRALADSWDTGLHDLDLNVVTVDRDAYAPVPWSQLSRALQAADGALILGFAQLAVHSAIWRGDTPEARPGNPAYATAWNHLEAGLALMAGLPVLVAPEPQVSEGIFAPDVWHAPVYGTAIDVWMSPAGAGAHDAAILAWARAVTDRAR